LRYGSYSPIASYGGDEARTNPEAMPVKTCERCGADAVDARGMCRNCGWQARQDLYGQDPYGAEDDAPSLGETRAADVPPGAYPSASPTAQSPRSPSQNPYPTEARPTSVIGGGATSGGRFCGTCGARLESGIAFCGQCGTPVAASGATGLTFGSSGLRQSGQEQYRVGGWSDGDGDEATEMMPGAGAPAYNGFGRSGVGPGLPYGAAPYHPAGYGPARPSSATSSSRTARFVVGALCLLGSIISASLAIILALTMR
jgi:hypothetical protein